MKTFVYEKNPESKKVQELKNIKNVFCEKNKITFETEDGITYTFPTRIYKTTTYQN